MQKVVFKNENRIGNGTQRKRLYETIRDDTFGFGCKTETETKRSCLLVNLTSKTFFLASSFLGANFQCRSAEVVKRVSTRFTQSFPQSRKNEVRTMSNYGTYENRAPERTCPICGKPRHHDWFEPSSIACWKCRETARLKRGTPEDGGIVGIRRRIDADKRGAVMIDDELIG